MINIPLLHLALPVIYIQILLVILLSITSIIFLFILGVILMDKVYREEFEQYPKHFIWDTLTPIVILITPLILILSITKESFTLMNKFLLLICIHGFILLPIMSLWSKHRKWNLKKDSVKSWGDPIFFKYLATALLYPSLWGFYFSIIRYLRLGKEINYNEISVPLYLWDYIYLIPFILLHLLPWILLLAFYIKEIREMLWDAFTIISYSIHLHCLRYSWYFFIAETLYKMEFIIYNMMVLVAPMNRFYPQDVFSKIRKSLYYIYYYPIIIIILCIISGLIEILIFKQLFYSFYSLFYGPLILSIFNFFKLYGGTSFVIDVCKSDYLLMRFENPHYPRIFWISVSNPELMLGFQIDLPEKVLNLLQYQYDKVMFKMAKFDSDYRLKLLLRVSGLKYDTINKTYNIIPNRLKYPYKIRLKAAYFQSMGVRWYHTTRILCYPPTAKIFHPITKFLCKDIYDYLALMDTNIKYVEIERLANTLGIIHHHNDYFLSLPKILISATSKYFTPLIESAQAISYKPLTEKGVISGTIIEMRLAYPNLEFPSMQTNPDVALNFNQSSFIYKRSVGVDFKNIMGKTMYSNRNQISIGDYNIHDLYFDEFIRQFTKKHSTLIIPLQPFFDELRDHAKKDLWNDQLILWANNLHRLPERWAPPLYTKKNLPLDAFKPEVQAKIMSAKERLGWSSEKAKKLGIPEEQFTQQDIAKLEQCLTSEYKSPEELAHIAEVMRVD